MNTTYEASFTSDENTTLIWDLLNENIKDRFSYNLKNNNTPIINKFFVDTINQVNKNQHQYSNIMEMNKVTLLKCIQFIEKNIQYIKEPNKKDVFEIRMKKQKDEFNSLMKKNVPNKIDFTDKIDNLPVDKFAVDQTLAERERELKQITRQYGNTDAESWIKNGTQNDDGKIKIIEDNTDTTIQPILMDKPTIAKRVTFEIKETKKEFDALPSSPSSPHVPIPVSAPASNNFLNKLKKKDIYDKVIDDVAELKKDIIEIKQKFESMETNQSKILELISSVIQTVKTENLTVPTN